MNGINEVITIANNWKDWRDPRLIIMVLANRDLNQVTWEQRVMAGDPRYPVSQTVPKFEFASYAELLGLTGIRVDKPDQIAPAWKEALSANRPVILEAITDPEVPTLPPHITFDQAKKFTETMIKGEPHLGHTIKQTFKEALESFVPHKK
jgi:pyruvate dehydrogenase (quinone)